MKILRLVPILLLILTACPPREETDEGNDELAEQTSDGSSPGEG